MVGGFDCPGLYLKDLVFEKAWAHFCVPARFLPAVNHYPGLIIFASLFDSPVIGYVERHEDLFTKVLTLIEDLEMQEEFSCLSQTE